MSLPTSWSPLSGTGQESIILTGFGLGGFGEGGFSENDVFVPITVYTQWNPIVEPNGHFVPFSATGFRTIKGAYGTGVYGHGTYGIGTGTKVVRNADLVTAWTPDTDK